MLDRIADIDRRLKLSSGSWLLNLACSNHPDFAMVSGGYYWFAGASSSGKTFWTLQMLAEAAISPAFDEYDLVFDNVEDGALMDIEKFFGPKLAARLTLPHVIDGVPRCSNTLEDMYYGLAKRFELLEKGKGRKFIYLTDSMDALKTRGGEEKFAEMEDDDAAGTYGTYKAKLNSERLPDVVQKLSQHDCILMVVSQLRDNINAKAFQKKHVVSGGHALRYYAHWQLWSTMGGEFTKEVNGNKRQIGVRSMIRVEKNRISGKQWDIELPIYWSHGIDDIGGCVEFLIGEKKIKQNKGGGLVAPDFGFDGGNVEKLIQHIYANNLQRTLRNVTVEAWREIEQKCIVDRVPKYQ